MGKRRLVLALRLALPLACVGVKAAPAEAAYRLCALRQGANGPCTCKSDTDGPGQFTVLPKSRCGVTPPGGAKKDAATAPAAAPAASVPDTPASEPTANAPAPEAPAMADPAPAAAAAAAVPAAPPPAASAGASRLETVRQRGKLLCGVNTNLIGFSSQTGAGIWTGLDVDFCRALAAAIFADAGKVEFVPLETNERFEALKQGSIDVLSRNTTWTMNREMELGLEFGGVLYFDGQAFMTGDERGLVSAQQLAGAKVCVEAGTTSEKNMVYYFKAQQIAAETKAFPTRDETIKAYTNGDCDAYSGDRSALFADRAAFPEPAKHTILPEVISKEPLGPAVIGDDREWVAIVRWTLAGLVNAEEVGLDKASASAAKPLADDALRLVEGAGASGVTLRLNKTWLRDAVAAVGNYGEMFEANVGKASPLGMSRGINALWKRGGILYAPPMW